MPHELRNDSASSEWLALELHLEEWDHTLYNALELMKKAARNESGIAELLVALSAARKVSQGQDTTQKMFLAVKDKPAPIECSTCFDLLDAVLPKLKIFFLAISRLLQVKSNQQCDLHEMLAMTKIDDELCATGEDNDATHNEEDEK